MNENSESPSRGMLRAFARSFGMILGFGVGLLVLLFFSSSFETEDSEVSREFSVKVQPNAKGVRTRVGSSGPVILQIDFDGTIGLGQYSADKTRLRLVESREGKLKDDRVKAILLNINSGGGLTTDSAAIYQMIKAYKEQYKVPVIAYADGLCASGAYEIALAADTILCSDCSVIGSVGVLLFPPYFNFVEGLEKLGIKSQTIFAGKGKESLNPFRPWQPNEDKDIQGIADVFYSQFVDVVVANRPKITREKLVNEYGAQIFATLQAKDLGFIDETGYYLSQAIQLTAQRAGIEDKDYHVVTLSSDNWMGELFGNGSMSMLFTKIFDFIGARLSSSHY